MYYGVREFGMSAIMNGITLHGGFIPYGGTFLIFNSYAVNAVRMAALMRLRVIFIYTHDSVGLGEDGPTHQPIEQLVALRSTPNLSVWRPCDIIETAVSWLAALKKQSGPTAIVLSRQNLPIQNRSSQKCQQIQYGGYIIVNTAQPDLVIIATGSEVQIAVAAASQLNCCGINTQVVSMPSTDVFLQQSDQYQSTVLPTNIPIIIVEAAATSYWHQFINKNGGKIIGIDRYGASGRGQDVLKLLGLTVDNVINTAKNLLKVC